MGVDFVQFYEAALVAFATKKESGALFEDVAAEWWERYRVKVKQGTAEKAADNALVQTLRHGAPVRRTGSAKNTWPCRHCDNKKNLYTHSRRSDQKGRRKAGRIFCAVIRLDVRSVPPVEVPNGDEAGYFRLIRAAFSQRRKTVANSVASGLGLPKARVLAALDAAGLDARLRPEQLTLEDYCALQSALAAQPG